MADENKLPAFMQQMVDEGQASPMGKSPVVPPTPPAGDNASDPPAGNEPPAASNNNDNPGNPPPSGGGEPEPFDFSKPEVLSALKNKFGEDVESFDGLVESYTQRKSKVDELSKEREILQSKLKEQVEFASPEIAEFNQFAKATNIQNYGVFSRIKSVDPETAKESPLDVLVTEFLIDNPDFVGRENSARDYILGDFGFDSEEEFKESENERQKIGVQIKAKKALDRINEYREKIKAPEAVDYEAQIAQREEAKNKAKENLTPVISQLRDSLKKFSFKPNEESAPYEFDFDDKTTAAAQNFVLETMINSENPYDEKVFQDAVNQAYLRSTVSNLNNILSSHAKAVREMTDDEYRKRYHRPSASDPQYQEGGQKGVPVKNSSDEVWEWQKNRHK